MGSGEIINVFSNSYKTKEFYTVFLGVFNFYWTYNSF